MTKKTAINTDVGEGFGVWRIGDDEALLDHVTAANVACGFHAGDPDILRGICESASRRGVSIGAQVSYRDLSGFGRRFIDVPVPTLINDLLYQMGALSVFARIAGAEVDYVKAHGALYNTAANHDGHAEAIVEAVRLFDPSLPILCQFRTALWDRIVEAELIPYAEAFIDRGYTGEGTLVARSHPEALITDPHRAADRAVEMVATGTVTAVTGERISLVPEGRSIDALCVHSDTPGAIAIAEMTRSALLAADIAVTPIDTAAARCQT
ncbi:LamB/YcsF family protein [Rhodococcus sp. NPDC055024]